MGSISNHTNAGGGGGGVINIIIFTRKFYVKTTCHRRMSYEEFLLIRPR